MKRAYIIEIIIFLIALAILETILFFFGDQPTLRGLLSHICVLLISILLAFILLLCQARKAILCVANYFKTVDPSLQIPVNALVVKEMNKFFQRSKEITTTGLELNETELEDLASACFGANRGKYKGTDSHAPIRFYKLYPTYLQSQATKRKTNEDIRLLLVTQNDLTTDLYNDRATSETFYRWHVQKRIRLLQVEPVYAITQAGTNRLPTCDIGIFDSKYIVFFSPNARTGSNMYSVWLWPYTKEHQKQICSYLLMLNQTAHEIRYNNGNLIFHQRDEQTIAEDENLLVR